MSFNSKKRKLDPVNIFDEGDLHNQTSVTNVGGSLSIYESQLHKLLKKAQQTSQFQSEKVEATLRKLKRIIEHIPSRDGVTMSKAKEDMKSQYNISIPFPEPQADVEAKYTLRYDRPENINVVGSFARKTAVQIDTQVVVDLAVTMPSHIFQDKDYLNYRYFFKRAYYLACLAAGIQENEYFGSKMSFALQNDNDLQPVILIKPDENIIDEFSKSKCQIRIILAVSHDLFPITKTLPNKNCIRLQGSSTMYNENTGAATPIFNASIRSECSSLSYLKFLHQTSVTSGAFRDACLLGSIWLRQRGFRTHLAGGGFGQFEWACTIALLFQKIDRKEKPVLSKSYNSFQLFKATLQFLAAKDLILDPLIIHFNDMSLVQQKTPMFFDGVRGLNILFKMTAWSYNLLRHEATMTVRGLNDPLVDNFSCFSLRRMDDPFQRFDYLFSVPLSASLSSSVFVLNQFCQDIYDVLHTGLSDRAKLVHLQYSKTPSWSLASTRSRASVNHDLRVGLMLNAEKSMRTVDHGPSAENTVAAEAFREFWGRKAEMRRFKDGSILETLIWNNAEPGESIIDQIVKYVLRRHTVRVLGNAFHQMLNDKKSVAFSSTALFQSANTSYEILEKEIRGLEGMPLQIRQVSPSCPELRYASLEDPFSNSSVAKLKPVDIYVQFEGSARWPDDPVAVQRTKIAFLLKIGELLESTSSGLTTRLGLENRKQRLLNQAFLDITYPSNTTFRLRIHHEQEANILRKELQHESKDLAARLEIAFAISTYRRQFVQGPFHTQAVRTICTRYPALSPTMRLLKMWRDVHLLSVHVSDELIELLAIHTFVHSHPRESPGSVMSGFLRTLTLIAEWKWQSEPLIVDFNNELSLKDVQDINLRFKAWRKVDPVMNRIVMFVASNLDPEGVTWTEERPSKVIAARFSSLAKSACSLAQEQGLSLQPETLFTTSTTDYDFLIHLSHDYVEGAPRKQQAFKNLQLQEAAGESQDDAVQAFLDEITSLYDSNILFFFNAHRLCFVAGLWNPQTTEPRNWKVNMTYSTMPVLQPGDENARITVNKTATLHDIAKLGGDIVSRIEVKR